MKDYDRFDLDEVKSKALPRLQWTDILKVTDGELSPEDVAALTEHFSHFTRLDDNKCPGCDSPLTGEMVQQLLGTVTFTWGLAHGEGHCRRCGYPARGYHYDIGPIKKLPLVLPYHPDELVKREKTTA